MNIQTRHRLTSFAFLLSLILLGSCKKDDIIIPPANPQQPAISKIQFATDKNEIPDNGNELSIEVLLNPKPTKPGSISIKIEEENAVHLSDYILIPGKENEKITLPFAAGAEKVSFRFKTVDDDVYNPEKKVKFTLEEGDGSIFKPEGKIATTVKILDNERHSGIWFEELRSSIYENEQAGYNVKFLIEPAANEDGFIEVGITGTNALYDVHFSTDKPFVQGKLRLPVKAGDESVSFKILPIQNFEVNDTRALKFRVTQTSELLRADYLKEMELFILDNGQANRMSIRAIHNSFKGDEVFFLFPTTISGRVISKNENVSPKVAFIEDETGGIAVEFTGNNNLKMGEMVSIDIDGGSVSEKNDMLTISKIDNNNVQGQGIELWVIPEMTLAEINQNPAQLEGRMVTLKNVSFTDANGTKTLEGVHKIESNNHQARVLVNSFASFKNRIIPEGIVSITGILVWSRNGYYTIIPQKLQDIR